MKHLLIVLFGPIALIAAPLPKRPPPSETSIVIADNLQNPTWKFRAAIKWRLALNRPGGVLIENWDFSGSIGAMPRDEIKDRVKFPKLEVGATSWLDVPGGTLVLADEITSIKDSWHARGELELDGELVRTGCHWFEMRFHHWKHPKKRFEFWIRELDEGGGIKDASIKANDNGTITCSMGTIRFVLACPDGEQVWTRGTIFLGAADMTSEMRRHDNWEVKGQRNPIKDMPIEYVISNRK